MIIRVSKSAGRYAVLHTGPANDGTLSLEAKGLMFYLLTKPDSWEVRNSDLCSRHGIGKHRLARILGELKSAGYLVRQRVAGEGGKFTWITTVYESPVDTPPALPPTIPRFSGDGEVAIPRLPTDGGPGDILSIDLNNNNGGAPPHQWLRGEDRDIESVGAALLHLTSDRNEFRQVWELCRTAHELLGLPAPLDSRDTNYIAKNWLTPALEIVRWDAGISYHKMITEVLSGIRNGYNPRNLQMILSNCEQYVARQRRTQNGGRAKSNGAAPGANATAFYQWFNAPPDQRAAAFEQLPDHVKGAIRERGPANIRAMTESQLSWYVKEAFGIGNGAAKTN